MKYFNHSKIQTKGNFLVGTEWTFRGCRVMMCDEGFTCDCKKQPEFLCNHIKAVHLGLLGVSQAHQK